LPAPKFKY